MGTSPDQSNELSMFEDDDGNVFRFSRCFKGLTVQLEYTDCFVFR